MSGGLAELLANHRLLAGLPVAGLVPAARMVTAAPGQLLIAEGGVADTVYLLLQGRVAIEVHAPDRGALLIETVGPGRIVGLSWIDPPLRWQFDARAMEPVEAIALEAAALCAASDADPAFGYVLMKRLAANLLERLQVTRLRLLDLYGHGTGL